MAMAAGPEVERAEELAAQHRLALLVARGASHEIVFATAAEEGARVLGTGAGAVLRFLGDERAIVLGVWRGEGTRGLPVNAELDIHRHNSALAQVRATRRPARIDRYEEGQAELHLYLRASGIKASLAAPILVAGEVWGGLVASHTRDEVPPPGAEQKLVPFADLVAQAVTNGEARRRLVSAADESRRRLERELHEGAQQHLLALSLKLRLAHERAEEGSMLAQLLGEALADAAAATDALDDLGRSLHPVVLGERGLAPALQALSARARVPVFLRELPSRRFPDTTEATVYAVVADGLAGVVDCQVEVTVADRGDRLHVELRGCPGDGMEDAADRVAALGGHLEADIGAADECRVRATIPVER
jgi:signal transduction histidine kinase